MKRIIVLLLIIFISLFLIGQQTNRTTKTKQEIAQKTGAAETSSSSLGIQQLLPAAVVIQESRTTCKTCNKPPLPGYHFNPYTGNIHREVRDLEIWGGVGEIPLVLTRYGNSIGGKTWDVSFNYLMSDTGNNALAQAQITVRYPDGDGGEMNVFAETSPTKWKALAGTDKQLFQYGNNFYLQMANGHRYRFEKLAGSGKYILRDFKDSYQNVYTVTYDVIGSNPRTRITEPAGRYVDIEYELLGGKYAITKETTSDGRSAKFFNRVFNGSTINWVLLDSVKYGDGTRALYTYHPYQLDSIPQLEHASDSRYEGNATNIIYKYQTSYHNGLIKEERNGLTNELMVSLNASTALKTVCYPNGRWQFYNTPTRQLGNAKSFTDGLGNKTQFEYANNDTGYLNRTIDASGRITTYDSRTIYGNPLEITHPDGSKEKWTRDTLDLVLTYTDELGRVTTYTRDDNHRIVRTDYPDKTYETFTYNNFGQVLDHRLQNGAVEHSLYDNRGLKIIFKDTFGNLTKYFYDPQDRLNKVINARNDAVQYEYNERGLLTKETNADGTFKRYGYDSLGNRTIVTDELGHTWTTLYDIFRRPQTITDPLKRVTTYSYDLPGGICGCSHTDSKPTKITLPSGKITQIEYDLEWRKIKETLGAGTADEASTMYEYDALGNLVTIIDPMGKNWLTEYDEMDRRKSSTDPLGNKTQWKYDFAGNVKYVIRPNGDSTIIDYDNMNRSIKTTDPKKQVALMAYDSIGSMIKLTDPNTHNYTFEYDLLNRRTKMIYPDNTFQGYTYDSVSNLKTYTTRASQVHTYEYDHRNRKTNSTWSDATSAINRTYDDASRLITLSNNVSTLSYTYDSANQLTSETQAIAGASAKLIKYHYNEDGLRDTMTYPDGIGLRYTYTNRNQLAAINTGSTLPLVNYAYDVNGNRVNKVFNNGTYTAYAYDDANRMLSLNNKKAGASFARFDYGYDNVDRRTYVKRDNTEGDAYTYDAIDQVKDVKYEATTPDAVPGNPLRTVMYDFDFVGNRKSVTDNGTATSYATNNLNQYTNVGASSLTNDVNGNIQTFDGWTYTYDAQNRLTKAKKAGATVDFLYDPGNRCVKQTINGTPLLSYYDNWNLIDERTDADVQIARYVHGAMVDEVLTKSSSGNTAYYHHDALGSVISLSNSIGLDIEKYSYDVFGKPTIKDASGNIVTSSAYNNRFMFTGREYIQEVKVYDYRNRMYSDSLGRFFQSDPLLFSAQDYNLYRYASNNSPNSRDPDGLYTPNDFEWNESKALDYNDFHWDRYTSVNKPPENFGASTYYSYGYIDADHSTVKWKTLWTCFTKKAGYSLVMDPSKSWVWMKSEELLRHEFGHLRAAEIILREGVKQMYAVNETACSEKDAIIAWQKRITQIKQELDPRMLTYQYQYDEQTNHGINSEVQQKWETFFGY